MRLDGVRATYSCGIVRRALGSVLEHRVRLGDALEERLRRRPNGVARRLVGMKLQRERLVRLTHVRLSRAGTHTEHGVVLARRCTVLHLALRLAQLHRAVVAHVRREFLQIFHRHRPVAHGQVSIRSAL